MAPPPRVYANVFDLVLSSAARLRSRFSVFFIRRNFATRTSSTEEVPKDRNCVSPGDGSSSSSSSFSRPSSSSSCSPRLSPVRISRSFLRRLPCGRRGPTGAAPSTAAAAGALRGTRWKRWVFCGGCGTGQGPHDPVVNLQGQRPVSAAREGSGGGPQGQEVHLESGARRGK